MRTLFLLGIALVRFILVNPLTITTYIQIRENQKPKIIVGDAALENHHLMIDKASVETTKANYELYVENNKLKTMALNYRNRKYF